ncbi:MAG: hypothetical protein IJO32_02210 [Bacilli bacterium]|nr:hypothetical protein [Bacilli bacterium]
MMEEMPKKKGSSNELTKKGKIILSIIVGVLAIIIFILIFVANKGLDAELIINAYPTKESINSYTYNAGNNASMNIKINGTVNLKYSYSDGEDYGVKWIISDENIAKVEDGKLVSQKAGTVTIYAVSPKDKNVKSNEVILTFK